MGVREFHLFRRKFCRLIASVLGHYIALALIVLHSDLVVHDSCAQSAPIDLADLSISELLNLDIERQSYSSYDLDGDTESRLQVGYQYIRKVFEGYRDGTSRLSNEDVLFRPGTEAPSNENFPVLPTKIVQEVHSIDVTFRIFERLSLSVLVPYIHQSTDHISVIASYDKFTLDTEGLGDISLTGSYVVHRGENKTFTVGGGISFPSGSIEEEGDTPRAPGNQQLPYTMQLGSGTYNLIGSLAYTKKIESQSWTGPITWGSSIFGKIHLGRNSRNYSLGDRLIVSTWLKAMPVDWLEPSLSVSVVYWDNIDGQDDELTTALPPPLRFPAPVTDPSLFGGTKVNLLGGIRFFWPNENANNEISKFLERQSVGIGGGVPLYQALNGPQPEEDWELNLDWKLKF